MPCVGTQQGELKHSQTGRQNSLTWLETRVCISHRRHCIKACGAQNHTADAAFARLEDLEFFPNQWFPKYGLGVG